MISSTSNSKNPGRRVLLSYILPALPFAAIYFALSYLMTIWGALIGEPYIDCNEKLEGARILSQRRPLEAGDFPEDVDIYFVGTSRIKADIDSEAIVDYFNKRLPAGKFLNAYNLGNIARLMSMLDESLKGRKEPAFLVLEYHPSLFLFDFTQAEKDNAFSNYKVSLKIAEMAFEGHIKQILGLKNMIKFGPETFSAFKSVFIDKRMDQRDFYYYQIARNGICQRLKKGGQITYRNFLKDREAGKHISRWYSAKAIHSNYIGRKRIPEIWSAFERIIDRFSKEGRVVVVRMPVTPEFYQLENQYEGDILKKFLKILSARNVPYIDMNPHDYYSSDPQHLDWYDTRRFSLDLAERLFPYVNKPDVLKHRYSHGKKPVE